MDTPPPSSSSPNEIPPNEPPRGEFRGRFGRGGQGGPRRFGRRLLFFGSLAINFVFFILILVVIIGGVMRHRMMVRNGDDHGMGPGPGGPMGHHHHEDGDGDRGKDGGMSMEQMEKMMMFMMLTKEMEHMQGPEGHPPMPGMGGGGMPPMGMPHMGMGMPMPPEGGPMGGREHNPKEMLQMALSHRLQLTDEEQTKLKQLLEDESKDFKAKLRVMLTPDQQKQLDAMPNF